MVRRLQIHCGIWLALVSPAFAQGQAEVYLKQAADYYESGQYFKSARYAFAAGEARPALKPITASWAAVGLIKSRLYQSASYFFIRTLQLGDRTAIERVLQHAEELMVAVGPDLLREYLIKHTQRAQYNGRNLNAYLVSLGKYHVLKGEMPQAVDALNGMQHSGRLWAVGLLIRGTALAIMGQGDAAIDDFSRCVDRSTDDDLEARCQAGIARTHYQMNQFREADRSYDQIPKRSFVWTDIVFEQAWNAFAENQFNRTLGKLVTYKSPSLRFVYNPEIEVLRAQAYLALCLYSDANESINDFHQRYSRVGDEVKRFVESRSESLSSFFDKGRSALKGPIHTDVAFDRVLNRFVRSPTFQSLVRAESKIAAERGMVVEFDRRQPGVSHERDEGFPGFVQLVLRWRAHHVRQLGGAIVKNSLIDYHNTLIADFEKIAFIKLEMLKRAKDKLLERVSAGGERTRGSVTPKRRDDQYYWNFNGEFWNDEIGDYIFGLESAC